MSLKTPYFPAQSGKIRTESGVYWVLKGVKSMIEVIYKEETDNTKENAECVKLPNNVRQIGEIKGQKKIYMEDYVYTFLKKIARNPHGDEVAAILFGSCHWTSQGDYIFIRSALQIRDLELSPEHIRFDDKVWGQVYEDSKKYFPEQEIVGWFAGFPGFNMEITEEIRKTHLDHFAGNDKVLFLMEPGEMEEAFYVYENNQLVRMPGHFIYYEKNDPMQAYMIDRSENKSIEETEHVPDRAVIDFRRAAREKKKETTEAEKAEKAKKHPVRNRWLAGACCAAAMLAVGLPYLNQYQNVEEAVQTGSQRVAVTSEAQKAVEEPLLSPTVTDEPEESLTPVPTQGNTQESLNPQANQEASEESSIPTLQSSAEKEEKKEEQQAAADIKTITYTIQRGDTLTSICQKRYGTISRIDEICQLNGISPEDIIYAGGKLLLPES